MITDEQRAADKAAGKTFTVDQELLHIIEALFIEARLLIASAESDPERVLALGLAAGAVMRVRDEHVRAIGAVMAPR